MRRLLFITILILMVLTAVVPEVSAGVLIIVHPDNIDQSLESTELERIYLGKTTHWSDDSPIKAVMLKKGTTHEAFLNQYMDRTMHRFVSYWRQMIFTGKGIPPLSFPDEAKLAAYVAETPGSVGYISDGTLAPGVQIMKIR